MQETQEKRLRDQHSTTIQITREQPTTTTSTTTSQDQNDHRQEFYSERRYHRTERETRHRSPSENSERISEHGIIDEEFKKKYLRCLAYMKLVERLYDRQGDTDEEETERFHRRSSRRVGLSLLSSRFPWCSSLHGLLFSFGIRRTSFNASIFFLFSLLSIRNSISTSFVFLSFRIEVFVIDLIMKKLNKLFEKQKNER